MTQCTNAPFWRIIALEFWITAEFLHKYPVENPMEFALFYHFISF